jgi:hypothetical protein
MCTGGRLVQADCFCAGCTGAGVFLAGGERGRGGGGGSDSTYSEVPARQSPNARRPPDAAATRDNLGPHACHK